MGAANLLQKMGQAAFEKPAPGNGAALDDLIDRAVVQIPLKVAAGVAETNTLGAPLHAGLKVIFSVDTLGAAGTRTITMTGSNLDMVGHNSIQFVAAGGWAELTSVRVAGGYTYKIGYSAGCNLITV